MPHDIGNNGAKKPESTHDEKYERVDYRSHDEGHNNDLYPDYHDMLDDGPEEDEPPLPADLEPKVVEMWQTRWRASRWGYAKGNHRGRLKHIYDPKTHTVVHTYFIPGQHCHNGNDTRRFRRDDTSGKVLGHNHRHTFSFYDIVKQESITPVLVEDRHGRYRKFRVGR